MTAFKISCAIFFLVASLHLSEQRLCFECTTMQTPIRDMDAICGDFSMENTAAIRECGDAPCVKIIVNGFEGDVEISQEIYTCGLANIDFCENFPPGLDAECISCDDFDYCNYNSTNPPPPKTTNPPTSSPPPNSGVTMTPQWMAFTFLLTLICIGIPNDTF